MQNVILRNEPKLSEHDVDRKFNDRRAGLVPRIKDYISKHSLFQDKEVSVTFFEKGVGSLVARLETGDRKFILKIPLSLNFSKGETLFLRMWEGVGVKVPHVYEEGAFGELSYILMEYIDAPLLGDAYGPDESLQKEIHVELGKTLRRMHEPQAEGYGSVVEGRAEYARFEDWFDGPDMRKRIDYVRENNLLGDEHGPLAEVRKALIDHVSAENKSSYCHDDFGTSNVFATDPITVFDPNPRFNNGYLDLGRSIVMLAGHSKTKEIEQLVGGYFGGESYDRGALQAAVILNSYMKLPYSHKKGRAEMVSNIKKYLAQNRRLLDD